MDIAELTGEWMGGTLLDLPHCTAQWGFELFLADFT
jgi:hypothetical protein